MEVLEAIQKRRSIRKYKSTPIPEDAYNRLLKAIRLAPSACNYQPYRFVFVTDEDLKIQVARACNDQKWMVDAPIIVLACGIIDEAYPTQGGFMSSYPIDVAIAMDHLCLQATAEGLATCWIGAFKEEKVRKVLDISSESRVVAIMPIGYPDEEPEPNHRKSASQLVSHNKY